jgi:hypothetical protein
MIEGDASKDDIILWLHKRADEIMWKRRIALINWHQDQVGRQRAGEINTRIQFARLRAPSIFDAPKGGQS